MRQDFKERDVEKSPTSDALQDSVGDITAETFLHVNEHHRGRDLKYQDGGKGVEV